MTLETFADNYQTTLAGNGGSITAGATTLNVASVTGAPAAGSGSQFRIIIDSEIMIVTAISSSTFTVTRGAEGTTAATHTDGVAVYHVLTSGALTLFAQGSATGPQHEILVSSYPASFNAAVAAASGQTTIVIDVATSLNANLTIPSTITLRRTGQGIINSIGTYTLTVNGPIVNPDQGQLFNVASGSLWSTLTISSEFVPFVYVEWFGAKGDGPLAWHTASGGGYTDNWWPTQSAINSIATNGTTIRFAGGVYRFASSPLISTATADGSKFGLRFEGTASPTNSGISSGSVLVWDGTASSVFWKTFSRDCEFVNLIFGVSQATYTPALMDSTQRLLDGPTVAPTNSAPASGGTLTVAANYTYVSTYVTSNGQETVAGPISAVFTPTSGNQTNNLSAIPLGPNTKANIYRSQSGASGPWLYIGQTTIGTFTDNGIAQTQIKPPSILLGGLSEYRSSLTLTALPTGGSIPAGTYSYKVTWQIGTVESLATNPTSAVSIVTNGRGQITNIPPMSAQSGATMNIYRQAGGGNYLLVASGVALATSYIDSAATTTALAQQPPTYSQPNAAGTQICTANRFRNCRFSNNGGQGGSGQYQAGVRISFIWDQNCEFFSFYDCDFDYAYTGGVYVVSGSSQSKDHAFERCQFAFSPYGIFFNSGSFKTSSCNFTSHTITAMHVGTQSDSYTILDCISEGCLQLIHMSGQQPVSIIGGRFSPDGITVAPAPGYEYVSVEGTINLLGVLFDTAGPINNGYFKIAAKEVIASGAQFSNALTPFTPATALNLFAVGCNIPDQINNQSLTLSGSLASSTMAALQPMTLTDNPLPALVNSNFTAHVTGGIVCPWDVFYPGETFVTSAGETMYNTAGIGTLNVNTPPSFYGTMSAVSSAGTVAVTTNGVQVTNGESVFVDPNTNPEVVVASSVTWDSISQTGGFTATFTKTHANATQYGGANVSLTTSFSIGPSGVSSRKVYEQWQLYKSASQGGYTVQVIPDNTTNQILVTGPWIILAAVASGAHTVAYYAPPGGVLAAGQSILFDAGGGTAETIALTSVAGSALSLPTNPIISGGQNYTSAPTITAVGGGGSGASYTCTISGGAVATITQVSGGSNYTAPPMLVFSGGGGTGAIAYVTAAPTLTATFGFSHGVNTMFGVPSAPATDTSGITTAQVGLFKSNALTATAATAGSNGDVPAQVAGYLDIQVGGSVVKVPYYNI